MALDFWPGQFVRRRNGTPCPRFVWFVIFRANKARERWDWGGRHLRIIARSSSPYTFKNPKLKEALEGLGLEWLTTNQISRIRECPAPARKRPRRRIEREFGYHRVGVDPLSPKRSPKCNRLFWAWRRDQKTCDLHWWAASMLRVEKHLKAKQDDKRKADQLADARQQLKRVRRANKKAQRLARESQARPIAPSELQTQNDMANFRLLQSVRHGLIQTPSDADSKRLEVMIRDGYVVPTDPGVAESQFRLSGKGLKLLGQLRVVFR